MFIVYTSLISTRGEEAAAASAVQKAAWEHSARCVAWSGHPRPALLPREPRGVGARLVSSGCSLLPANHAQGSAAFVFHQWPERTGEQEMKVIYEGR